MTADPGTRAGSPHGQGTPGEGPPTGGPPAQSPYAQAQRPSAAGPSGPWEVNAWAGHGSLAAGSVGGDVQITYYGAAPDRASAVSVPLAVPQRRVASDRLRGREALVGELTEELAGRGSGAAAGLGSSAGPRSGPRSGVWVLSGMGGCGKTTVALEVAHRLGGAMSRVWWVSGADAEGLTSALRAVAFAAGAVPADFLGAHPADVLWTRLTSLTEPWLLVLDNVDDPALLAAPPSRTAEGNGWLRLPGPRGKVLVTSRESRAERWGGWVRVVDVEPLSGQDGAQVLTDLAPRAGGPDDARALAEHLGGLPLALDLAGSYLARALEDPWPSPSTPGTFTAYRHGLGARLADMATDRDADLSPAERTRRTIVSTWDLSLDLLHRQGADLARPLLRLLCSFGPAPLPYLDLLDVDLLAGSEAFPDLALPRFQEALRGLAGLGLVAIETGRTGGGGGGGGSGAGGADSAGAPDGAERRPQRWITIHPMVRAATRAHPAFAAQAPELLRLLSALLMRATRSLDPANHAHWPRLRAIAPHGSAPLPLLSAREDRGEAVTAQEVVAATEPAVRTASYRLHAGLFGEAVGEIQAAGEVRTRLLGEADPATLAAGLALAWALRSSGDLMGSDALYARLTAVCGRTLPAGHPYLATVRTGRARTLAQLGRYDAAGTELRVALTLRQADPEAQSRSILRIRSSLARIANSQGRFEEAARELFDIRVLTRDLAAEGELDALSIGPSLVRALRDAGRPDEAEAVAEEVVAEHEAVLPPYHPALLIARHERARLLRDHERDHGRDRGYLERARDEFTEIWLLSERHYGAEHPDTLAIRHELATVWHLLGDLDRAAEHFRAAWEGGRRKLGDDHPHVGICARNLAAVLAEQAARAQQAEAVARADRDQPAVRAEPSGTDAVNTSQGAATVNDSRQYGSSPAPEATEAPAGPAAPDAAPQPPDANTAAPAAPSPAVARLLDRYLRADRTLSSYSGDGEGPAYSAYYPDPGVDHDSPAQGNYRPFRGAAPAPDLFADLAEPAPLDAGDIRALARGEDDRHLAERLWVQQRGARLLVLRDVLDRTAEVMAGRPEAMPATEDVRTLLARAGQADRQAVSTVLLHPTVGRWMSRTLRALRRLTDDPAEPLPADLLHLHCVAAAVAVRAGIRFELPLPVRGGFVFLPTLGTADMRAAEAGTALIRKGDGRPQITCGGFGVFLAQWATPENAPTSLVWWRPALRITMPSAKARLDFLLDDADPYRETAGALPPAPLPGDTAVHWSLLATDASDVLARVDPRQAQALAVVLRALTPRTADPSGVVNSVTSSDAFGGLVASLPPDGTELAATLVHEFRHMKLNAVLDHVALDEEGRHSGEAYYAPWRDDPRPLPGLFHGVYAFVGVVEFWRKALATARGRELRHAQFQWHCWSRQTRDAYEALRASARLTAEGRDFVAAMGETVAAWADAEVAVPRDVAALAEEAIAAHRTRWRLHHLRPDADAVAGLAAAWLSGTPGPPARDVATTLHARPGVEPSTGYTALLCRAASTDPGTGLLAPDAAEPPDPADLARLGGSPEEAVRLSAEQVTADPARADAWVRLTLALRGGGGTPATAALTHRPEVVRAVFARVAAEAPAPPDAVALTAWLAPLADPAALPDLPAYPRASEGP